MNSVAIILASKSPRRQELLRQMGVEEFLIVESQADETVEEELPPEQVVRRLAARKADAVFHKAKSGDIVIAADTIVTLEGVILGKPKDKLDAFQMLSLLSGTRHQVYTGLAVYQDDTRIVEHECTSVYFREISGKEIEGYLATGEPMDKAGSYGIQGRGSLFVERIDGDYFNVVGLPICRLGRILTGLDVKLL